MGEWGGGDNGLAGEAGHEVIDEGGAGRFPHLAAVQRVGDVLQVVTVAFTADCAVVGEGLWLPLTLTYSIRARCGTSWSRSPSPQRRAHSLPPQPPVSHSAYLNGPGYEAGGGVFSVGVEAHSTHLTVLASIST